MGEYISPNWDKKGEKQFYVHTTIKPAKTKQLGSRAIHSARLRCFGDIGLDIKGLKLDSNNDRYGLIGAGYAIVGKSERGEFQV